MSRARTCRIALASPGHRVGGGDLGVVGDRRAHLGRGHPPLAEERHQRVRAPAHRARIDDRRVGADHAVGLEPVDAPLDRRRAQRDAVADGLEGRARIRSQLRNDLPVDLVHIGHARRSRRNVSALRRPLDRRIIHRAPDERGERSIGSAGCAVDRPHAGPRSRLHAAQRHPPRRALRGQRAAGGLLLRARLRLPPRRLPRPGDRHARPGLPRPSAGPHPPRPHRRAALRLADRRPPAQARRRREGHRPERAERRERLPRGHDPRRRERRRAPRALRRARHGHVATIRTYGETLHTFVQRDGYDGPFLPGFEPRRGRHRGHRDAAGHRPHRRQRRARRDGHVGQVLRGRLRDDRDDPLLRRRHLDRVLGAHVQGRQRRQGPREVPHQRARRGQAQVADRRVPRVLRGRRAPSTSPSPRATSSAP